MRNLFTILISFFFFYSSAQTKLYVSPEADEYVAATKTIAIVPLKVEIKMRPKQLKDFTSEQITDMELDEAYNIQKSMYSWFLNKKKKGKLLVNIQSPKKTNKLLKDAGIDPNISHEELASDLSGILGVEAIITGTFETNKPMSNAAAIGLALLGVGGATQNVTLNLDIIHKDDEIVVNYLKNIKGGLGSSTDDIINVLMRKTARRIPYTD